MYYPNYMRMKWTLINYPTAVIPPHDQPRPPAALTSHKQENRQYRKTWSPGISPAREKQECMGEKPLRVVSSSHLWSSSHEIYRLPRYRRRLHLGRDKVRRQGDCETSRAGHEEGCPASHTNRVIGPTHMETVVIKGHG